MPLLPLTREFGRPGSRFDVETPALVLDLDALEGNIRRMAAVMAGHGRGLRPHAKSHKSVRIARLQVEAGALGICCATIDEAEVMAAAGLPGLLLTSPLTAPGKIGRYVEVLRLAPDTMVVVDHPANLDAIAAAAARHGLVAPLVVDIDLGFGRTGVADAASALALARRAVATPGTAFAGLQAYGGHLQHIADHATRVRQVLEAGDFVAEIVRAMEADGIPVPVVTGGGTGTHAIDGAAGPFTEIQAGSYALMDAEYGAVAYDAEAGPWPFDTALFVQTTVISTNVPGVVSVDAGTKAFALNGPRPLPVSPALPGAAYEFAGDEHGRVRLPSGAMVPGIGDRIECVVSHCDPTVAHYDFYHCVRGDILVDIWPVDARGRRWSVTRTD